MQKAKPKKLKITQEAIKDRILITSSRQWRHKKGLVDGVYSY
jgi:hypothetical protein